MKRYILSIILCLWSSCSWAFSSKFIGVVGGGTAPYCTGKTSLICLDFEEAGTPSGMSTVAGDATINYDSTSPRLDGTQSMRITSGTASTNVLTGIFASQSTVYAGGLFQFSVLANNTAIFEFRNSSQGRGAVLITTTGAIQATAPGGTSATSSAGIVAVDTPIYILCGASTGSGNAQIECWTSTDGSIWTSRVSKADGTFTGTWDRVWLDITTGSTSYSVDRWRVENAAFNF